MNCTTFLALVIFGLDLCNPALEIAVACKETISIVNKSPLLHNLKRVCKLLGTVEPFEEGFLQ